LLPHKPRETEDIYGRPYAPSETSASDSGQTAALRGVRQHDACRLFHRYGDRLMSNFKWPLAACLLLLLCSTFSSSVLAQTTTAVLEGTATDTTGALLRGVTVQAKGDTADRTVVTDSRGFYRVAALPAGVYSLTASLSGFQ